MTDIFEFYRPMELNFMVIEVLGLTSGKNIKVIVFQGDNELITVGSDKESDLVVADCTVSKKQAKIKLDLV